MALAMICDRCGEVYNPQKDIRRFHVFDKEKEADAYFTGEYHGIKVGYMLDLCDSCNANLEKFIFNVSSNVLHGDEL